MSRRNYTRADWDLAQELQTLREKNAELEKELARVRGQRDGLARLNPQHHKKCKRHFGSLGGACICGLGAILQEIDQEQEQEKQ